MNISIAGNILAAIRSVIGPENAALHVPEFSGNEKQYLENCIDSTFVSYVGEYVSTFEEQLALYTGVTDAVAVVNGTEALHIALLMAGVEPGDEVLVPGLTFVATANAVRYCGAIPHFIDCEEKSLGIDVGKLDAYLADIADISGDLCINRLTGRSIKCLIPMHTFGHPVEMDACMAVAAKYQFKVVEDAAESLGSFFGQKHTGTFGYCGILSFNGNKIVTTGGGGALLFNDPDLAARARYLTTTAKEPHRWEYRHLEVGYNYRMPNINAALGCAQLEQLSHKLANKRLLYQQYRAAFADIDGITLVSEPENCKSNYWLQTLLLDADSKQFRDEILTVCNEAGVMTRPAWNTLDSLPMYRDCPRSDLGTAHDLFHRIINIPSSPGLING